METPGVKETFKAYLEMGTPLDVKTAFDEAIANISDEPVSGLERLYETLLVPALEEAIRGESAQFYRKVLASECAEGLPLGDGYVIRTATIVVDGNPFVVGEACGALLQVLGAIMPVNSVLELQSRLVLAWYLSSLIFPANQLPYCWSGVLWSKEGGNVVRNHIGGVATPGEWKDYRQEKRVLSRARLAGLADVLPSRSFGAYKRIGTEWWEREKAASLPGTDIAEPGNCAELPTFRWICQMLHDQNRRHELKGTSITLVTVKKLLLDTVIGTLRTDIATKSANTVYQQLMGLVAVPTEDPRKPGSARTRKPGTEENEIKRAKIVIIPCDRCSMLGTVVKDWADEVSIDFEFLYDNVDKGIRSWKLKPLSHYLSTYHIEE